MARCSDLVPLLTLAAGEPTSGNNFSAATPITGPNAMIGVTFVEGAATGVNIKIQIGESSTGAWYNLLETDTTDLEIPNLQDSASPACFAVSAMQAGESFGIAGPWIRLNAEMLGTPDGTTAVSLWIAFSLQAR